MRGVSALGPQEMRERLIARAITVIANEGLDRATTKAIVKGTGINEVYIYRYFSNKEDLLAKTFAKLDEMFVEKVLLYIPVMYRMELDFEQRCRFFFTAFWEFLLDNREVCLAFRQYYYSPYFLRLSAQEHKERCQPIVQRFREVFRVEADVWMIINHILNVMLDFAVMAHNGQMPSEDAYEEHVFRVVYYSVQQYFKKRGIAD